MFYKILFTLLSSFALLNASLDIKNLESFEAKFTQDIKSNTGSKINYNGEVYIKNSGKILWKYQTPIEKNVYILNNFVIIEEPELEQAIYTTLDSEINIIELIRGAKKIQDNIYLANIDNTDYKIEVKNDKISSISYKDKLDNSITISFNEVKQNQFLDDDIFKFDIPDYYDIIRK